MSLCKSPTAQKHRCGETVVNSIEMEMAFQKEEERFNIPARLYLVITSFFFFFGQALKHSTNPAIWPIKQRAGFRTHILVCSDLLLLSPFSCWEEECGFFLLSHLKGICLTAQWYGGLEAMLCIYAGSVPCWNLCVSSQVCFEVYCIFCVPSTHKDWWKYWRWLMEWETEVKFDLPLKCWTPSSPRGREQTVTPHCLCRNWCKSKWPHERSCRRISC